VSAEEAAVAVAVAAVVCPDEHPQRRAAEAKNTVKRLEIVIILSSSVKNKTVCYHIRFFSPVSNSASSSEMKE
jgi:hypothetical protein